MLLVVRPSRLPCNGACVYAARRVSASPPALRSGKSDWPSRVPRLQAGDHAEKGPEG